MHRGDVSGGGGAKSFGSRLIDCGTYRNGQRLLG
jgi:hypothetical protein